MNVIYTVVLGIFYFDVLRWKCYYILCAQISYSIVAFASSYKENAKTLIAAVPHLVPRKS